MTTPNLLRHAGFLFVILGLAASALACGDDLDPRFRRPGAPFEATLFDLFMGPIDRPSALDVLPGAGSVGAPLAVRVDQTDQWDVAFAVVDGEPVWLPRGFFVEFEASSGILPLDRGFDEIERVPGDRTLYEMEQPVPVTVGTTYAIRSRSDPNLSLPCRIFAKLVVDELQSDPVRIRVRFLWNPNCDQVLVTPEEG